MNCELSYSKIKTANEARISEEIRDEQRRRNLLVLILHHLTEEGYLETCRVLESESGVALTRYKVCDNVDLTTVLQEYEAYYYVKFNKYPKITKKENSGGDGTSGSKPPKPKRVVRSGSTPVLPSIPSPPPNQRHGSGGSSRSSSGSLSSGVQRKLARGSAGKTKEGKIAASKSKKELTGKKEDFESLNLAGTSAIQKSPPTGLRKGMVVDMHQMLQDTIKKESQVIQDHEDKILKPIAAFAGYSSEMRELAAVISRDIYLQNPDVRWSDIMGLEEPKRLVKEAVVYPIKYPQLFTGILSPWKGLLLYGPPGTGKTMLAKAVATECSTTFFNITASTIVSKWRGDSEKLVRVLFELARFHAPSTIFIDELESIMSQRGYSGSGEHEGSRRMKTELLVQMDGLAKSSEMVFLLAASNLPWELDHAMLRRLEKRILVDLPTQEGRKAMLYHHLPPVLTGGLELKTELDYASLAEDMDGYSGSDIKLVCKEAAMRPLRKVFERLESQGNDAALSGDQLKLDPVLQEDVEAALAHTKPSAYALKDKYLVWQRQYESV